MLSAGQPRASKMKSLKNPRLKPHSYIEISLEKRGRFDVTSRAAISDCLYSSGVLPGTLVFFESRGSSRIAAYVRSFRLLQKIRKNTESLPKGFRLKWKILEREDWLDKWQLEYQIMPLGKRFTLVPLWQKEKFNKLGRTPIFLDPKGAFGSGTHATTRLMINLMEKIPGAFESFLDAGTGTGILSVAARKLGAETLYAFDKDPASVRAAKFNFRANGIKAAYVETADLMRLSFKNKFRIVAANMISAVLIEGRKVLWGYVRPGGYLVISGIHLQNLPEVKKSFKQADFRCLILLKRRGWAGLLYQRKRGPFASARRP